MKHLRIKTRLFRRAALSLLTFVMAFTAQTARADDEYGWYDISMSIGGSSINPNTWSGDPKHPTDLGTVSNMTFTNIAFKIWSNANDRGGANMFFRVYDDNGNQIGSDQDLHLGTATRITGDHDFSISYAGPYDLANAVGLTLVPGKTYYIDVWFKSYGLSGDQWYSNGGANFHSKLTIPPASYESGNCTATLNDGVLTISGTGAMADYAYADSQPWAANRNNIKTIVINDGVTSIGNYAFSNCESATSVSIPASVKSIGNFGFFYCTGISSLTIAANSSLETIGSSAFYCAGFQSITIPAKVTSIGNSAFDCCANLTKVTLNSNPSIGRDSGTDAFGSAAVTMNLTANSAGGANWMTFYNQNYSFQTANTQVFKVELSGDQLTLHEIENKIVDAGTAVVLKSSGSPVMTLTTTASGDEQANSLIGVSEAEGVEPNGTVYVLNYTAANGVGFYRLAPTKTVGVGKAYLTYGSGGAGAREFFLFGDEKTGIEMPTADGNDADAVVYDLQGRRVKNPVKGLYIVNGKMVIIK